MERGHVRSFFPAANRRFGFIRRENGPEHFFHADDYRPLEADADGRIVFGEHGTTERMPGRGDEVVFISTLGRRGHRASRWAYACEYEAASKAAADTAAANAAVYRVIEHYNVIGQDGEDKTAFEGTRQELERRFPRPMDRRVDELASGSGSSDFDRRVRFVQRVGDTWAVCQDPRVPLDDQAYRRAKRGY